MNGRWLRSLAVASSSAAIVLAIGSLHAQRGSIGAEWRTYAGDLGATKYSPLTQIDASNFGKLKVVWRWQSADAFLSRTIPGRGEVWASFDAGSQWHCLCLHLPHIYSIETALVD